LGDRHNYSIGRIAATKKNPTVKEVIGVPHFLKCFAGGGQPGQADDGMPPGLIY
jgi:hypothetical protein